MEPLADVRFGALPGVRGKNHNRGHVLTCRVGPLAGLYFAFRGRFRGDLVSENFLKDSPA